MTAFIDRRLIVAERAAREVSLLFEVLDTDITGEAIVAGKEYDGVAGGTAFFERREDLAHRCIRFHDEVSGRVIQAALTLPLLIDG
jgi:hypothetical protein